ncbi:hypothetical protein [Solirubrum puertoriconensis]|uniref:DUF748 domain-containing protein n=1 Tax=Solirubrum puertoriconensis TaxID=1751427 RepID=A0A9X0L581_SOLP1|nr:hypothetical protein [Solirubrum puertoriconensis]KUG08371.1 hypothetical protein ASU33_09375 [Solirubrum puertoriconensis]
MPNVPTTQPEVAASAPPRRPRRWLWWVGGAVLLLVGLAALGLRLLDPWLQRTLQEQVARKTNGQYELRIGALRTSLRQGSLTLRNVWVRPAGWPKHKQAAGQPALWLLLTVDHVRVGGVSLGALLKGELVAVDTVLIETVRAQVLSTPTNPAGTKPLHEQLPKRIPGIRIGHFALRDVRAASGLQGQRSQLRQGNLVAQDILISRGGASDSTRLGYASAFEMNATGLEAQVPGHHVRLGAARFSSRSRQLQLDSLRVVPVADKQAKPGSTKADLWLPQVRLSGLQPRLLPRRVLQADSLRVVAMRLQLAAPATPPPPLHKMLAPYLQRVQVGHVHLGQGQLRVTRVSMMPEVRDLNIVGTNIRIDSIAAKDAQRVLYARDWQVRTGPTQLRIDAPYYRVRTEHLGLSTRGRQLRITGLLIQPNMGPEALARGKGHQASHVTFRLPELRVTGLDFGALERRKAVLMRELELRNPRLHIISNSKHPINPNLSVVTPENVGKLPFRLDVRTLRVRNFDMRFTFTGKRALRPGHFTITRLNGVGTNISNDPKRMSAARPAVLQATAYLGGKCRLQAKAWVPLLDANGTHRVEGTFGPTPFALLNPVTEPTRFARFERGQLHGLRATLLVNRREVTGTVWARYSNLKVDLLSRRGGGPDRQKLLTKVVSKASNVLVVRDDNPRSKGKPLEPGKIRSDRNLHYGVFSVWLQGMNSGLLNSVGVPSKMAEEISEL